MDSAPSLFIYLSLFNIIIDDVFFQSELGWSVLGSLGWTGIVVGPVAGPGCCAPCKNK